MTVPLGLLAHPSATQKTLRSRRARKTVPLTHHLPLPSENGLGAANERAHSDTEQTPLTSVVPAVVGVAVGRVLTAALRGLARARAPLASIALPKLGRQT